jgi:DNA invertase Pin-like site-specific DNA recombinase
MIGSLRSAQFVSLHETWCDTTTPVGRLMITVMGGIAEFEPKLIKDPCEQGIEGTKALGTNFGRKVKLSPEQRRVAAERYAKGETHAELAKVYQVS